MNKKNICEDIVSTIEKVESQNLFKTGKIPKNHYFDTNYSYLLLGLGKDEKANKQLKTFFSIKRKGHNEFNIDAILSILLRYREKLTKDNIARCKDYCKNAKYTATEYNRQGNNWLYLKTLCHLKQYLFFKNRDELNKYYLMRKVIQKYLHSNGFFYDAPKLKKTDKCGYQFPLAYSFKMLALLIEMDVICKREGLENEKMADISKAVTVHLNVIGPDGEGAYYGRSDNTLFAYANIIKMCIALKNKEINEYLLRVYAFVKKYFFEDGLYIASTISSGFRDRYINDNVYLAYYGATLLKSIVELKCEYDIDIEKKERPEIISLKDFGWLYKHPEKRKHVFISEKGSNCLAYNTDFYGYRYTGLTPMKVCGFKESELLNAFYRNKLDRNGMPAPFLPYKKGLLVNKQFLYFHSVKKLINGKTIIVEGEAFLVTLIFTNVYNKLPLVLNKFLQEKVLTSRKTILKRKVVVNENAVYIIDKCNEKRMHYIVPSGWNVIGEVKKISDNEILNMGSEIKLLNV